MWIYGWKAQAMAHHFAMFSASRDIKYSKYHKASQNHVIENIM